MGNSPSLGQGGEEPHVSRDIGERDERPQSNRNTELAEGAEKSQQNPLQLYYADLRLYFQVPF